MRNGEEDEGAGEVDHVVHGQTHHQVVEVPPGAPQAEQEHTQTVADHTDRKNKHLEHEENQEMVFVTSMMAVQLKHQWGELNEIAFNTSLSTSNTPSVQYPNSSPVSGLFSASSRSLSVKLKISSNFVKFILPSTKVTNQLLMRNVCRPQRDPGQ